MKLVCNTRLSSFGPFQEADRSPWIYEDNATLLSKLLVVVLRIYPFFQGVSNEAKQQRINKWENIIPQQAREWVGSSPFHICCTGKLSKCWIVFESASSFSIIFAPSESIRCFCWPLHFDHLANSLCTQLNLNNLVNLLEIRNSKVCAGRIMIANFEDTKRMRMIRRVRQCVAKLLCLFIRKLLETNLMEKPLV